MKAVLVIDMPSVCDECRLHLESSGGQYRRFCVAKNEISVGKKKPKWCPLKPLPKKKIVLEHRIDGYTVNGVEMTEAHGWNDCLNEILGETE